MKTYKLHKLLDSELAECETFEAPNLWRALIKAGESFFNEAPDDFTVNSKTITLSKNSVEIGKVFWTS